VFTECTTMFPTDAYGAIYGSMFNQVQPITTHDEVPSIISDSHILPSARNICKTFESEYGAVLVS
jgi:hypothetical protein